MNRVVLHIICVAILGLFQLQNCYASGVKIWEQFKTDVGSGEGAFLLDFSYAGYHHGEMEINEPDYKIFNVVDFGATPDDQISDRDALLRAIAAAEENGSGVVFLPRGRYLLNTLQEPCEPIIIRSSNVVLRGEGSGVGGTEIFMQQPFRAPNPKEKWTSPTLITFRGKGYNEYLSEVIADSRKGSFTVEVDDASKMRVGEWVCLRMASTTEKVIAAELKPYSIEKGWSSMEYMGVQVYDYHLITAIEGTTVTFKEPLMRELLASEKWFVQKFTHTKEVGVEDIAFVGNFKDKFVHHKDDIHDGGWKFIEFESVVNSWLRACRFTDVSSAVSVRTSANVSVFDVVITGNTGHHAVASNASSRIFIGGVKDKPAQWHSTGVTKHTMGTVIWRNWTAGNSCFECHASQSRATLFDACKGGFMRGRCGGAVQNNPNHLADLVFWNYNELDGGDKDFDFWPSDTPYFRFLPPIIVGFHGAGTTFKKSTVLYEESNGKKVEPESLYEEQLKLRLGELPQWLVALKTKVERGEYSGNLPTYRSVEVTNTKELADAVRSAELGDEIIMQDGNYKDVKLIVNQSGTFNRKLTIRAANGGKVTFSGDVKVELRGSHISLEGVYFRDGERKAEEWKSHGEGLVAIYGDYCNVVDCLFYNFDTANSSYISTSLDESGRVPTYAHIDRCAFIGKTTLDQVINLNNTLKKTVEGEPAKPMYHRVSHCYFSNPKKKGNAGGGIRIGYWRKDYGRCLIDNNLFERQDSEPEIVTSKSMENVFYNNTFLNSQGTLNFRHGDTQVAINNFFISNDTKYQYGGMYVWGSNHIIANNFFKLSRTIESRGSAALYFNTGPIGSEHALAYNSLVINNLFSDNDGYCVNLHSIVDRRIEAFGADKVGYPHDIKFIANAFYYEQATKYSVLYDPEQRCKDNLWQANSYNGAELGVDSIEGLDRDNSINIRYDDSKAYFEGYKPASEEMLTKYLPYTSIKGIDIDFLSAIKYGIELSPLSRTSVGPLWSRGELDTYINFNK